MTYEQILASMRGRYRELSGFEADQASDIGIRLQVVATEVADFYVHIDEIRRQVFPQTSSGNYLELHAQSRAIARKPAIPATGKLKFIRETPAYSDISIPAGILCATKPDPQVHFKTTQSAVLVAGANAVEVDAVAVDGGVIGNVATGAVCTMISPAVGISGVINSASFLGGSDGESDDALRNRLVSAYQNISNGTNSAFYYDLAMSHEGVFSAQILPRKRGRGTVDVVITGRLQESESAIVKILQADLNKRKEINVDVLCSAAVRDFPAISVDIAVKSGYSFSLIAEQSRLALKEYVNSLGVGVPLLLAEIGSKLLAVDGVYNYKIISPADDVVPLSNHVLRSGNVSVSGMAVG